MNGAPQTVTRSNYSSAAAPRKPTAAEAFAWPLAYCRQVLARAYSTTRAPTPASCTAKKDEAAQCGAARAGHEYEAPPAKFPRWKDGRDLP